MTAHETGTQHVETDLLTMIALTFGSVLASGAPLFLGLLSYYLIENSELLHRDNNLIPLGLSFGAVLFLVFDYASLSSIFAFHISKIVFQTVKLIIVMLVLIALSGYVSRAEVDQVKNQGQVMEDNKVFYVWVGGLFIHTIGEGIIMGYNFTLGLVTALAPLSITSYMMHKYVEGFIAAVLLSQTIQSQAKSILVKVGVIIGLSILPGAFLGYFAGTLGIGDLVNTLNVLLFTIGFTVVVFVVPFMVPSRDDLRKENYYMAVIVGLVFMFVAVVLHDL